VESEWKVRLLFMDKKHIQERIIVLLCDRYYSPRQVMDSLKIKKTRYYQILTDLIGEGKIKGSSYKGYSRAAHPLTPPLENHPDFQCRLHGQEWNIQLGTFTKHRNLSRRLDKNLIQVFNHSINIYAWNERIYYNQTAEACLRQSMAYWTAYFEQVEAWLGIYFYSKNQGIIKQVSAHYEEWNSNLAKWVDSKQIDKLLIKSTKDGVTWCKFDKSLNANNTEFLHPATAKEDYDMIITNTFNGWRDGTVRTPMQQDMIINQMTKEYAENIKLHLEVLRDMRDTMRDIRQDLKHKKSLSKEWGW
jgi:hypothetical protein